MAVIARRTRRLAFVQASAALALVVAFAACVGDKEGAKGSTCDRAGDCADGLFCVQGACSDDLSKVDGGSVPTLLDSGTDAPAADAPAETPPGDAVPVDTTPGPDTGTPTDTTPPPTDTTPPTDTKPPPTDTAPPPDTTPPPTDTAPPPTDTATADTTGD